MIALKEEFIKRYVKKLTHKLEQNLKDKLPEKDYFANMVEQANEIVKEIAKII